MTVTDTCIEEKKDPHSPFILQRKAVEMVALRRRKKRQEGDPCDVPSSVLGAAGILGCG